MKHSRFLLAAAFCCCTGPVWGQVDSLGTGQAQPRATWVGVGPNERVWKSVTVGTDSTGREVAVTNSYVELASGLCWWNEETEAFEETQEAFEIAPDGTAVAARGQHKVFIKANLNEGGAVDMFLPDGQRFRSNPMGLSYFDAGSGKNVLLGEIKDCQGEQIAPNVLWFPDAFDTIKAGIRFTYTRNGFEQDVVIQENPGAPEEWGLESSSTTLECYTELYDIQEPQVRGPLAAEGEEQAAGPSEELADGQDDPVLDFGSLRMERGTAYLLHGRLDEVPVRKSYEVLEDNRRFLIEHVPYLEVAPVLDRLQARASKPGAALLAKRSFPGRRELAGSVRSRSRGREMAAIRPSRAALPAGLVLDYYATLTSSITNYVMTNGSTFYVSGPVSVVGSLRVESGVVVKYASGGSIDCGSAAFTMATEPYCVAHFTAKDDNTVGDAIAGSTGAPSGYYANPALKFSTGCQLQHLRVSYAQQGIFFSDFSAGGSNVVSHAQFVRCHTPLQFNGYGTIFQNFFLRNVLITNAYTAIKGYSFNGTVEHLTVNSCNYLAYDYNGQLYGTTSTLSLKNSLLCGVGADYLTRAVTINRNLPYTQTVTSSAFAGIGAAGHYLSGSTYRNTGTTNINATLLADIRTRTTYPPLALPGPIQIPTILGPQAVRDGDTPDLGYHYAPLDYVVNGLVVTNATLTMTNGVALGYYGNNAIWLQSGSSLVSEGTPLVRNHLTRFACVQEASTNWGGASLPSIVAINPYNAAGPRPNVSLRFTDLETSAADGSHIYTSFTSFILGNLTLKDCKVLGGKLNLSTATGVSMQLVNNVIASQFVYLDGEGAVTLYNNLFYRGGLDLDCYGVGAWTIKDNHFQQCDITDWGGGTTHGYNAYVGTTGLSGRLTPNGTGDVVLGSFNFAAGAVGPYYQSTTTLQNVGSEMSAATRGLYHYATLANQTREGTTRLDIGFHYVAVNASSGLPVDTDGDGLPDYLEDRDGNGSFSSATETDWQTGSIGFTGAAGLQVFTPLR